MPLRSLLGPGNPASQGKCNRRPTEVVSFPFKIQIAKGWTDQPKVQTGSHDWILMCVYHLAAPTYLVGFESRGKIFLEF